MDSNGPEPNAEFIEDPYFHSHDHIVTPSLDDVADDVFSIDDSQDSELDLFDYRSLGDHFKDLSFEPNDGSLNVETEFYTDINRNGGILNYIKIFRKSDKKQVRVIYSDLTKPYMVKMSNEPNFKQYLGLTSEEAIGAVGDLSADEVTRQRMEWQEKLAELERDIESLRTVLNSKIRESNELKHKLGITVWREITDDVTQGIKNVKESNVYQKTTSVFESITGSVSNKLGQMRHSESFRSIEEKVGSAFENVKTKVTSRSSSMQSLDETLNEMKGSGSVRSSTATSPTIPEEKPIA